MHQGKRSYLPELDGLRFIAFFCVFMFHFPKLGGADQIPVVGWIYYRLSTFGWAGVDLFFCLSAFLITRLLLLEREQFGTISIGRYFLRRILRIWPLYFLALLIGFVILPVLGGNPPPAWGGADHALLLKRHLLSMLFFFENFMEVMVAFPPSYVMQHLWTISVEEQIYLFLPLLAVAFTRAPMRVWFGILLGVLGFALVLRAAMLAAELPYYTIVTNTLARPDAFVFGALAGWLSLQPSATQLANKWSLLLGLVLILATTFAPPIKDASWHALWIYPALGAGCALVLLHATVRSGAIWGMALGNPVATWLGKVSYGLYIYHRLGTALVLIYYPKLLAAQGSATENTWLVVALLALGLTVLISAISYYAFERWFLVLKLRYVRVASRGV